jgi:uncharacterized paraquat-inducible protein A
MNNLPKTNILRLTIEIAVFVAVVVADAYGLVPITQTLFLVPLIWIMLRLSGERWSRLDSRDRTISVGQSRSAFWLAC